MKRSMKRILAGFLCMLLIIAMIPIASIPAYAANGVTQRLDNLKRKFPDGKYWNHYCATENDITGMVYGEWYERFSDNVTDQPCATHNGVIIPGYDCNNFDGGIQCCGFAKKLFYEIFGERESSNSLIRKFDGNISVGDYVSFSGFEHYAIVTSVSGDSFTVAECNVDYCNCKIRWGATYYKSQIGYYVHSNNYDAIYNQPVGPVTVTFTPWWNDNFTYIYWTDASIGMTVSVTNGAPSYVGMILYNAAGTELARGGDYDDWVGAWYFKINEELGYTLSPRTLYKYKFYAIVNGQTYSSDIYSFTTDGNAVTGVSLNKTTLSLEVGKTETLTPAISPSNASNTRVTWTSDKTSVATVDSNGKVTAKAAGTAKITVKTEDGGYTASCTVTVIPQTVAVTGVSLNKTSTTLNVGATETLTATVAPSNASNKAVTWSSDKTSVATVDANGKVTAVAPGTAKITVKTVDGGYTASCTVTVTEPTNPDEPTLSVASPTAMPGGTVRVPITLANNPGLSSLKITITYDRSVMTLNAASAISEEFASVKNAVTVVNWNPYGSEDPAEMDLTVYPLVANWMVDPGQSTKNGVFLELVFDVKADAPEGSYSISVTYDEDDVFGGSGTPVNLAVNDGVVKIIDHVPGDMNGDGKVNNRDAMALFRYVSGLKQFVTVPEEFTDVNGDGKSNNRDAMMLFRYVSGIPQDLH